MTETADVNLWPRIRDGDAEAFAQLFDCHGARIHAYALRRTADPGFADDVTALVFLEVWRRRREVELHQRSALPWLFGVAGNVIRRWHRTRRRHRNALDRLDEQVLSLPANGFATQDIVDHVADIYGSKVSKDLVGRSPTL